MPRKSAAANPSGIGPAPRPPFPGIRDVISHFMPFQPANLNFGSPGLGGPETAGFPDPGNCTPHEPVVFLPFQHAYAIFRARRWPASVVENDRWHQPWNGYGGQPRWHMAPPPPPTDGRTDNDFYPGLEGEDLMKAWFTEVAEKCGWKDVQFFGRTVLLISKLA